jgi:glycosyltransferase involved in cell wall biosynthesis
MIAFHFPPAAGSSGIQRTLRFARHLPQFGWEPVILTASPRAYERTSSDQVEDVAGIPIERAFALDSARHLSVMGRYAAFTARPDRWISWWLGALPKGLAMIRRYRPDALWSTYPIATAHKIGHDLACLSRLPWIADFRDPMAQDGYPTDRKTWNSFKRIEAAAMDRARSSVFVTPGAARMYRERYAQVPQERIAVIENGYDEDSFEGIDALAASKGPLRPGAITLLHSGIVYPSERDPNGLFRAVRMMLDKGDVRRGEFLLRLRACAHESMLQRLIDRHGVGDLVELQPPIPYREALLEMARAEALLVLQASNCNDQVPAKLYEYMRCRRPLIGLTDPQGDTASVLRRVGVNDIARLDSAEDIAALLRRVLRSLKDASTPLPNADFARRASRQQRTAELATLLDRVIDRRAALTSGRAVQ